MIKPKHINIALLIIIKKEENAPKNKEKDNWLFIKRRRKDF